MGPGCSVPGYFWYKSPGCDGYENVVHGHSSGCWQVDAAQYDTEELNEEHKDSKHGQIMPLNFLRLTANNSS